MPTDKSGNFETFVQCLGELAAIVDICNVDNVYVLGDFNADPDAVFGNELLKFCKEQELFCADIEYLGLSSGSFTFLSKANGATSWLDHIVTTQAAKETILNAGIRYEVSSSDHFAIELVCDFNIIVPKVKQKGSMPDKVIWGERDEEQIARYFQISSYKLRDIDFPVEFQNCADVKCNNMQHRRAINTLYDKIVCALRQAAADYAGGKNNKKKKKYIIGWNKHCKKLHEDAKLRFHEWVAYGKPRTGHIYEQMRDSRSLFKSRLKWCKNNENQIKMDILASQHAAKNFSKFWKETDKMNPKPSVPVSVEGVSDTGHIANLFREYFRVHSNLGSADDAVGTGVSDLSKSRVRFTAKQVAQVVKNMKRGKSPGHDSLSIEHLQHAGVHLPRVLALLFNFCLSHSYLPEAMMRTIVVPIIKNKTADASKLSNYRPISLATVIAKVLDGLIDCQLKQHIHIHDAQFGFRPGLSTEMAVLNLKHTVQYYTARGTPVYACFLDLSKAFDLVSYDRLWFKLVSDTDLPSEYISILKYWYSNQSNFVRWSGSLSGEYRLECGVRQGGLSSPTLFNLYIDRLIRELSGAGVGCSIDGVLVNNISYADDMVLLSPSISALRKLILICERYAQEHGLRYNAIKSELMVFKAGSKTYNTVPPVKLNDSALRQVSQFKYLGHWVTEALTDDVDMERERRALSVRGNMLARRFARCTAEVKITLFRAFCQSFYTCSLWTKYTRKSYDALRIQYNNVLRALLRLPRWCSASGMFADAHVDGFAAILRKRVTSLTRRVRASSNSYMQLFAWRMDLDCPIMQHWTRLHIEHSGSKPQFRLR